jgi:hypothetical protein
MKRTNCDEHSEYSGSQTRRGHHNQPPDAVKDAADRIGPQCGAGHNKTVPQSPADDARQFNFMPRFYMRLPPTRQGALPGSCALLIEPTVTRMARFSGPAASPRHPTAMHKTFIAALKQVKTGKFDADGDEL